MCRTFAVRAVKPVCPCSGGRLFRRTDLGDVGGGLPRDDGRHVPEDGEERVEALGLVDGRHIVGALPEEEGHAGLCVYVGWGVDKGAS